VAAEIHRLKIEHTLLQVRLLNPVVILAQHLQAGLSHIQMSE
jgi:hypothetical protein